MAEISLLRTRRVSDRFPPGSYLKLLQTPDLGLHQSAIDLLPAVEGGLAHAPLAADFLDRGTRLRLLQGEGNLLVCELRFLHRLRPLHDGPSSPENSRSGRPNVLGGDHEPSAANGGWGAANLPAGCKRRLRRAFSAAAVPPRPSPLQSSGRGQGRGGSSPFHPSDGKEPSGCHIPQAPYFRIILPEKPR